MNGLTWRIGGMILTRKTKYRERNLSQFHFVHHKSLMDWPVIESRPPSLDSILNLEYVASSR
jgi:hypothetical protein